MLHWQATKRGLHAASRTLTLMGLLAVTALFSACGGGAEGIVCTLEARTSVLVNVVDPLGAALPGVMVVYRVDGGAAQSQACDSAGLCAVAFEVSGVFALTATKPGYAPASTTVTVTRDVCHVNTERVTLTLRLAP
jgi:hypothetical protein